MSLDDSEILSVDEKFLEEELQELEEQLQQKLERDKVDSKHPEKLMDDKITKSSLEKSIEFISQLELTEEDYEEIFSKFKPFLKSQAIKEKLDKLEEIEEDSTDNLETMTKRILDRISMQDLNFILDNLIEDEDLTNFIQDLKTSNIKSPAK